MLKYNISTVQSGERNITIAFTQPEGSIPANNSPLLDPIQSEWNLVHVATVYDTVPN